MKIIVKYDLHIYFKNVLTNFISIFNPLVLNVIYFYHVVW
jgi:hypothetical protein